MSRFYRDTVVIGNKSVPAFKAAGEHAAVRVGYWREQEGSHKKHKNSQTGRDQIFVALCVFCGHQLRQQPAAEISEEDDKATITPIEAATVWSKTDVARSEPD